MITGQDESRDRGMACSTNFEWRMKLIPRPASLPEHVGDGIYADQREKP